MRFFSHLSHIALLMIALTLTALGQGTLQGVVTDAGNGKPLIGANVFLRATALGGVTDLEGKFKVVHIPAGTYKLRISYIGYKTKESDVQIVTDKTIIHSTALEADVIEGQEVVITAQARGQMAAINQQLTSRTIVNVVSEEKIKELSDANAAEAIGRLPGVSLIRSGGEASKIVLRGLSSKFSSITVDGVKIPATDPNSRDVDLSTISQGALSGIELFKTLSPDQDADAIAGSVNLVTRNAPSERSIVLDLKGDYNNLMKSAKQYDFSARYGERFFDDVLGIQLQGNIERKIRSREDITYSYQYYKDQNNSTSPTNINYNMGSFTVDFTDETRTRNGAQAIVDVKTPDSGTVKLSGMYSSTGKNTMLYNRAYVGISGSNGSMDYNYRYTETDVSTMNASLQGKNFLAGLDIDWGLSYAHSRTDNPFDFAMKFTESPGVVPGGVPSGRDKPEENIIPFALNDFIAAACSTSVFYMKQNFDKDRTASLNITRKYTISDLLTGEVKGGGKYREKARWMNNVELDDNNILHGFSAVGVDTSRLKSTRFLDYFLHRRSSAPSLSDFVDYPVATRDLLGKYRMTPLINVDALKLWYDLTKNAIANGETEYGSSAAAELADYAILEKVSAAYLMHTLNFGQEVSLITGLRVEKETNDYQAKFTDGAISTIVIRQNTPKPPKDTTATYTETIWLPNVQLTVRPTENLTLRGAAYRALARPDYNLRLPNFFISGNGGTTFNLGNPNLRDTKAWNYEVNVQVHSNTIGLISVSAFYKVIDDLYHQMSAVSVDAVDSLFKDQGMTWQNTEPFASIIHQRSLHSLTVPYNSSKSSYAWGVEFEHQMNLGFLPGYLSNFTLSYNVSLTRSETNIIGSKTLSRSDTTWDLRGNPHLTTTYSHVPVIFTRESEGQPKLYGNAAVGYDIGGFSARVSVFYQDQYVQQYSQDGQADVVTDPYAKVDLAVKQKCTDNISLLLNINNITNRAETTSFRNTVTPWLISRTGETYGTTIDFGVRVTL
ncbi:MAG: TonB-dependent receptor [Ignavibacteriales bacterium]|nr:TonB-dependent receptor [Ignavibacteriales bacterium]